MIKIELGDGEYLLEEGLISKAGKIIKERINPQKSLIISDKNVFSLYGKRLEDSFADCEISVSDLVFDPGEESKNLVNFEKILNKLSEDRFSRSDALVILGGGVMGDLGGFAASCFKRGMKLIQIPTSLLAMVDSSVGGKTGVNLDDAKNQVGSFYQPSLTIADPACLETLPLREYKCGCGEVIKYAVLFDADFFNSLLDCPISEQYVRVIKKCVTFKRNIVENDILDKGCRQLLNFGHTVGHAVEALSNFKIAHGEAVAIGMAYITRAAYKKGFCGKDCADSLVKILDKYRLPYLCKFEPSELYELISKDKKISGDKINVIIPREIGRCVIQPLSFEELINVLDSGASK